MFMCKDITTKNNSLNLIFLFVFYLINSLGIILSHCLSLPLWLDSIGTMFCVYFYGIYAGLLCIPVNIATLFFIDSFNFVSPAVALFLIYGTLHFKKKNSLDVNSTMIFSAFVIFFSFIISLCINMVDNRQLTENLWGSSIISFCNDNSIHHVGLLLASFYLEFMDKLISILVFYGGIHFLVNRTGWLKKSEEIKAEKNENAGNLLLVFFTLALGAVLNNPCSSYADENITDSPKITVSMPEQLSFSVQQTVINQKNGLISGNVTSLCSTSDGYIWIGSYAGLLKYDGKSFKRDESFNGIRNVKTMYAEGDRLWVGTTDQGIFSLENGRITNHLTEKEGLLSDYISGITSDDNNNIYIATPGGISILKSEGGEYTISSVYKDGNFISVSSGLGHVFAIELNGIVHCFRNLQEAFRIEPSEQTSYTSALYSDDGFLYLSDTSNRISRFTLDNERFVKVAEFSNKKMHGVKSMMYSSLGEKYKTVFISSDSGIFFIKGDSISKIETENFSDSIEQGIRDFQGNLWFASSRLGLVKFFLSPVVMVPALKDQVVNCIAKWHGNYLFGTDFGIKAYASDLKTPLSFDFTQLLEGVRIRDVYVDSSDYLWICTYGKGVFRVKDKIEHFSVKNGLFGNKARSVLEIDDSRVMLSGASGVSFFDKNSGLVRTGNIFGKDVTVLSSALGDDGKVYAGTNANGIYIIRDYKLQNVINKHNGLISNTILKIYPLKDKKGIIAVTGDGLCYISDALEVRELKNFHYFNNYDIIDIGDDKVAVTGSNGVYVVNLKDLLDDNKNYIAEHLDSSYGITELLSSNSRNYKDGNILFLASNAGVFMMDTKNYHHKDNVFKMQVEKITVDGNDLVFDSKTAPVISRASRKVTLYPSVLNFSPENPYVGVCLEGLDEDFSNIKLKDLSQINYTNIAPGDYVFTMALFDSKHERKSDVLRFPFSKAYAFYDSKLFVTYFVLVSCLIVAYFTFFLVKLLMQKIIDEKQHLLELAEQQIKMGDETILTIAQALDARDPRTKSHSVRVAEYSVMIAKQLGFTDKECSNLRKVALLHDIGKIGIPDRILNKPERLTDEEYGIMKSHVTIGAEILKNFKSIDNLTDGIKYHHERYDGKGYVLGVKGEEIPIIGRIISVADAFDAMSANRVYRDKLQLERVMNEIEKGKGSQFDPKIADIMLELIKAGKIDKFLYNQQ
ncbi:energy-coupling factor transport system substrate-specific component [Succinivibrio dextrinosolvens DSM 3072]|uniref:Energy-coupling factor transport system substrate-specific component n=1 Tax=Succinivibrio dextrinosolvens DSM 3072 TaxID=1123324 RepID=A0A1T4VRF4_9GAMM|nr:energy-coupling factor transport system substrate-specific component [Succinivibrio dextrinosolvens DSM 3072]